MSCRWFRLALVVPVLALGCGDSPATGPRLEPSRGAVLISLDTLAASHLGAYGYERDTSPFLDRLAAESLLFERAFSPYPSTLAAHMSMLTGLYPEEHGVIAADAVLGDEIATLPELLQAQGLRTAAFTEGGYVRPRYGFARGFDEFRVINGSGSTVVEKTLGWGRSFLEGLGPDQRFFLFLHTYSVHTPYDPPAEYVARFWEGPPPAGALRPSGPNFLRRNAAESEVDPEHLRWYRALYDATIRYLDDQLAGFFAAVDDLGLAAETTVVVTADHGEEFLEHGRLAHTQVYPESLHVPLVVRHPGAAPRRVADLVRTHDLPATVLELLDLDAAALGSGRSLAPLIAGGDAQPAEAVGSAPEQRTLTARVRGRLLQLVLHEYPEGHWFGRRARLDLQPGGVLEALAYRQPRTLEVRVGDAAADRVSLSADSWTRIDLGTAEGARRIELRSDGCTHEEKRGREARRCLAFRLRGVPLERIELFDLDEDRRGLVDIAPESPELTAALSRRLRSIELTPHGETRRAEPDAEALEELRALGYLE